MELNLGTLRNMANIQAYHFATLESVYMKLSLGFFIKTNNNENVEICLYETIIGFFRKTNN